MHLSKRTAREPQCSCSRWQKWLQQHPSVSFLTQISSFKLQTPHRQKMAAPKRGEGHLTRGAAAVAVPQCAVRQKLAAMLGSIHKSSSCFFHILLHFNCTAAAFAAARIGTSACECACASAAVILTTRLHVQTQHPRLMGLRHTERRKVQALLC